MAALTRPDFTAFVAPYYILLLGRRGFGYSLLFLAGYSLYTATMILRFGFSTLTGYGSSQLGIPFYTFFQNRFLGACPQCVNPTFDPLNEALTWGIFVAVMVSVFTTLFKKGERRDVFSLTLIALGSTLQPAYSYFAGFYRYISIVPMLYKLPVIYIRSRRVLTAVGAIYASAGLTLLVAWFY